MLSFQIKFKLTLGAPTDKKVGADGICSVSFIEDSPELGKASTLYEAVVENSAVVAWVLKEVDITFPLSSNWCFDRKSIAFNQVDFETVALHEFAHAHLIDHVNDRTNLMHYALIGNSVIDINETNIECGKDIIDKSIRYTGSQYKKIILPSQKVAGAAGAISGNISVCIGNNPEIYTVQPVANAASYLWTLPEGVTGASSTNSISLNFGTNAKSGNILVRGITTCMQEGQHSSLTVNIKERPETPVIRLDGEILVSSAANGNQWYFQNTLIPGAVSQSQTISKQGLYFAIVNRNGCYSDTSNVINAVPTSADEFAIKDIVQVYPVPAGNELIIELPGHLARSHFIIVNALGYTVMYGEISSREVIDTSSFSPGLYFVEVFNPVQRQVKKFIKI